jgi:hypothetical protein
MMIKELANAYLGGKSALTLSHPHKPVQKRYFQQDLRRLCLERALDRIELKWSNGCWMHGTSMKLEAEVGHLGNCTGLIGN